MKPEVFALASNVSQALTVLHGKQYTVRFHLVCLATKLANLLHGFKPLAAPLTCVPMHFLMTVKARGVLTHASAG